MLKPNTFIVGAPKCGTTAMASYLSDHKNVFMSEPKEPHHFVHADMPKKTEYTSLEQYLNLFSGADADHKVIAEASVWYLYSADAIEKIATFNSNAKIIAMLRRPDEMVYSMHSQALVTLQEDIADFELAWNLSRKKRSNYPRLCKEPKLLQYKEIANYGKQLKHVKKYFPDEQLHVVFYDDFKLDTMQEYNKVLQFLDLPPDGRQHFPTVNPNTQLRNERLGIFLKKPPAILVEFAAKLKNFLGIKKLGIHEKLTLLNQKTTQRKDLSEEIRSQIIENYRDDVATLSMLIGRDLTHWLS